MVKNLPANAGDIDAGSIPGSGRSLGEGYGSPLQYSCPENSIVRGAWQATVHSVAKNRARLKRLSKHVQRKYSICKLFLELHEWLVSRNIFVPRGHTAMSRDVLPCHNSGGAAGIRRVEARGAAYVLHEVEQPPQQRIIQLHVSVLPRLRNLRLNTHVSREGQG